MKTTIRFLTVLTGLLVAPLVAQVPVNGSSVSVNGNVALPSNTNGSHGAIGASGTVAVQFSDGTGTAGHLAAFDANGRVTDGGTGPGTSLQIVYWSNQVQLVPGRGSIGAVYTNTNAQRIDVNITLQKIGDGSCTAFGYVMPHGTSPLENQGITYTGYFNPHTPIGPITLQVPPSYDYKVTTTCGDSSMQDWVETTVGVGASGSAPSIYLTTAGNGGLATLASNVLNIPQYATSQTTCPAVTYSSSPTLTFNTSCLALTLTGNVTSSSASGFVAGNAYTLYLAQDGTGNHSFVQPGTIKGWPTDINRTANGKTVCTLTAFSDGNLYINSCRWI